MAQRWQLHKQAADLKIRTSVRLFKAHVQLQLQTSREQCQ